MGISATAIIVNSILWNIFKANPDFASVTIQSSVCMGRRTIPNCLKTGVRKNQSHDFEVPRGTVAENLVVLDRSDAPKLNTADLQIKLLTTHQF
ncbi:MAG: hypothetical protein RKP20_11545 [Candidatus Competibacter sp.]|nr:hypothetical protein [Candidatus Competibacter sp.]